MKFLLKLDPMTVLMLVVLFGVVITMLTQASTHSSAQTSSQKVQLGEVASMPRLHGAS